VATASAAVSPYLNLVDLAPMVTAADLILANVYGNLIDM